MGTPTYDAAGDVTADSLNSYLYDAEGRLSTPRTKTCLRRPQLCAVRNSTGAMTGYGYDAEGNRVGKTGSSAMDYIYFNGQQVARFSSGAWTDQVYGSGGLLAEVPNGGSPTYRLTDHLGSGVATVSGTVAIQDYAPFGQLFNGSNTNDPYRYTGKERDTESGNDYFGARYYASSMGRFLSPDPSQLYYADPTNPQSLNLYAYGQSNPLINIDPSGLDACAYDLGDGTATILNAGDGGGIDCPGNGFYITTTQQVSAVGFNQNGDLSVYGADGNLYNPDNSAYDASQSITVGANGGSDYSGLQPIESGTQYINTLSQPQQMPDASLLLAQGIAKDTGNLSIGLDCATEAAFTGGASYFGVSSPTPNPARQVAESASAVLAVSGKEGVGAMAANGVRVLGPTVAKAVGTFAEKNAAKVVPFALAIQGGLAAKDAINAYKACNGRQ